MRAGRARAGGACAGMHTPKHLFWITGSIISYFIKYDGKALPSPSILTYLTPFPTTRHHSIWACRGTDTRGIIWRDEIDGRRRCATENVPIFWNMCCYCCCCICCISRSDRKCNQYLARMNQNLGPNQCKTARYGNSIRMSERVIQSCVLRWEKLWQGNTLL